MERVTRTPSTQGARCASDRGAAAVEYRLDGRRWIDGAPASRGSPRWTSSDPPGPRAGREAWRRWCLLRDAVLAATAGEARARGEAEVEALAVVARWSETHGSEYTAGLLAAAGVPTRLVFIP